MADNLNSFLVSCCYKKEKNVSVLKFVIHIMMGNHFFFSVFLGVDIKGSEMRLKGVDFFFFR